MNQQSESESKWPLERALFLMAGTITILSAVLAAGFSPWFLLLTGFVGVNQLIYVAVGACPASLILGRACSLKSSYVEKAAATRSAQ
jgi:hypothetical protein